MASIFKRNGKGPYLIAYFDHEGRRREKSSRTSDWATADRIGKKLDSDAALRREGIIDAKADRVSIESRRPIGDHSADFKADLLARGGCKRHVRQTTNYVFELIATMEPKSVFGLLPSFVQGFVDGFRRGGSSLRTCNARLRAIKQFSRWLEREGRIASDPLRHLRGYNADIDHRRQRRGLSIDELGWLISTTNIGPEVEGVSAIDRAMFYRISASTGFRVGEMRSLTPSSFELKSEAPTITVNAAYSKRRREDVQPIRDDLAEEISNWLDGKPRNKALFDLPEKTARMMRFDLRRARAAWIKETRFKVERRKRRDSDFLGEVDEEGRVCDCHSLRHSFISNLISSGASVKIAQELARHSTPTLTIGRYAHVRAYDLKQALDNMAPMAIPEKFVEVMQQRATGTDDVRPRQHTFVDPPHIPQQSGRETQRNLASGYERKSRVGTSPDRVQNRVNAKVSEEVRNSAASRRTAPRRTRTFDPLIKSQQGDFVSTGPTTVYTEHDSTPSAIPSTQIGQDNELSAIISAWPLLPEDLRTAISTIVDSASQRRTK